VVQGRTGGPKVQRQGVLERGANWLRDQVMSLLEEHAPELVPILRQGVIEWLKERLGAAVQAMMDTLAGPVRTVGDLVAAMRRHFSNLVGWLREAGAKIARGDCSSISEAADKIHQVFDALVSPVVDRVKHYANRVKEFFQGLWDRFGAPVWALLQRIGGAIWEQIQRIGRWIWEKTQPIRDWLSRAWRWFKNWLGIGEGEEGQNGILQWFQRKASEAWEWVSARLAPYKRQILIVIGILALLSPAGPIIAITAVAAGIMRGIQWLRQNMRNRGSVVQGRGILRGVILPAILGAIDRVSSVIRSIASAITGALNRVMDSLNDMLATVSSTPILRLATGLISFLADAFRGLLTWANEGVQGAADLLQSGLQRLGGFARMLVDFLERVAAAVANVLRIGYALGGRVWNLIPACIRDPFIDFFIPLILGQISFFRELVATPEAWQQTRAQVMQIIRQVFRDFDLFGAMRSVFRLIVRALRIPVDLALQVLEKGAQAFDLVVAAPLRFIENSLKAILRGIGLFMRNFLSHLWYGVQGWLLNAVEQSGTGIRPPETWDLRGLFGFVLSVLGISLDHVLDLLATRVGRPVVQRLRQAINILTGVWEWVKIAIEEGPAGLWRKVTESLSDLGRVVLQSAVGWVMTRIIAIVSARLTALAASAGLSGILEAVVAVYQAITTAIEYMRRILQVMLTVFTTIVQIARGIIDPAAQGVEQGLRMIMPVVIGFLANYAGLGGIGGRIREIIMDVRARVDRAILALIDRAIALGRSILDRLRAGVAAVMEWWRKRKEFRTKDRAEHAVFFQRQGSRAELVVNPLAPPKGVIQLLDEYPTTGVTPEEEGAIRDARTAMVALDRIKPRVINEQETGTEGLDAQMDPLLESLARALGKLKIGTSVRPTKVVFAQSGGRAVRVMAAPLTKTPGNTRGSADPSAEPPGWLFAQSINAALPPNERGNRSVQWNRAHLLSYRYHGPGDQAWNLTPANIGANSQMTDFEEDFQSTFDQEADKQEFWYKTVVAYGRNAPAQDIPSTIVIERGKMNGDQPGTAEKSSPVIQVAEPSASLRPASLNVNYGEEVYYAVTKGEVTRWAAKYIVIARRTGSFTDDNLEEKLRSVQVAGYSISDANIRTIRAAISRGDLSF
jgi:hypothetical protein